MTLRRRLVIATSALAVVLFVAGAAVVLVQRAFLVARLDAQLSALAQNPRAILLASARAEAAAATTTPAGLSDIWVGRMSRDGTLTPVLTPQDDPTLAPRLGPGEQVTTPQGRDTASGQARRVRVVTATLPNGRAEAVLAIPLTSVDVATKRLTMTLGLAGLVVAAVVGLLLWWVDRLGLRPIAEMTDAADAITAGDTTRRVRPGPPGTEAARLGEALNAMIDTNAATSQRMRRFVADASHELRTPLTTLQGYAALHTGRVGLADAPRGSTTPDAGAHVGEPADPEQVAETGSRAVRRWPSQPPVSRWPRWPTRCAGWVRRRPGCAGSSTGCSTWPGSTTSASWRATRSTSGWSCATWRATCAWSPPTGWSPSTRRSRSSSPATATG